MQIEIVAQCTGSIGITAGLATVIARSNTVAASRHCQVIGHLQPGLADDALARHAAVLAERRQQILLAPETDLVLGGICCCSICPREHSCVYGLRSGRKKEITLCIAYVGLLARGAVGEARIRGQLERWQLDRQAKEPEGS